METKLSVHIVGHRVFAKSKCVITLLIILRLKSSCVYSPKHYCVVIQRIVMNRSFLFKITFTGGYYYTLAPINVKTSRHEFDAYKVCAKYDDKIKPASWITVNCKVSVVRYIIIQRKSQSRTYWTMQICEVVVIGHLVACK